MAQIRFANNVSTQLTKPVAENDSAIEVRSLTQGLTWPNISATGDYFLVVIDDISTASWEIMKCTHVQINGNETVLTVERGLEGTTATDLQAGSVVENRLTAGTLDSFGAGFPTKVEISQGGTGATTAVDARTNLDVPSKADLSSEVSTRTSEVARLDQKIIDNIPPAATTSVRGTVILSSATDSVSEALAATPKAVKTTYDKAVSVDTRLTSEVSRLEGEIAAHTPPDASLTTKGIVQLNSAIDNASEVLAATPKAVKTAYDKAVAAATKSASADKLTTARGITLTGPVTGTVDFDGSADVNIPTTVVSASTSAKGIVQLSSATDSESETTAATSKAIKLLADNISVIANVPVGGIIAFSGTFGGSNNRYPIPLGSTTIDTNWCLCDGTTTNSLSVPDLRGRMIRGASDSVPAGSTGGSETHTHSLSGTVGETTLSTEQMPAHGHSYIFRASSRDCGYASGSPMFWQNTATANTSNAGGSQSHTHTLDGASGEADSLPPYYALAYIMRIA